MSSLANHHNQTASASMSESDHEVENECDSSSNRQNESMMHKVKDVVSKIFHPSFLFSTNEESDRNKRKRSTSVEERQAVTTDTDIDSANGHTTTSRSRYVRSTNRDDDSQITDDEDNNNRDGASTEQDTTEIEQQKKRRRTANYQHILSTKPTNAPGDDHDERTSSQITTTDSFRSLSIRRGDHSSSITQNPDERINRFTPVKQRFDILPSYRTPTSTYDPTKSPLFSAGNRRTTTTTNTTTTTTTSLKSNEFSANYLLASGLASRPQTSSSRSQQSPATLTNPNTNTRPMFAVNYSSINSRRLPYIERLRRRTLQDCIRLNRTLDSEPLSESIIEEHKSTTASPAPKRTKPTEKDCGIQCDISTMETSTDSIKKVQRTFPPTDIRDEALAIPTREKSQSSSQNDSPIQTNSSITIEKTAPKLNITKPKVLGNVTPFSWPKFARAQEAYAKKHPEKCRLEPAPAVSVNSVSIGGSNTNTTPIMSQQTNTTTISKTPMFSFGVPRPAGDIWKCPSCTKEHPAQTATCSLCRQINPSYIKPSAIESTGPTKIPVSSNKLPDSFTKESSVSTPTANPTVATTTKETPLFSSPIVTTSATLPSVTVTPSASTPVTTKESTTTTTATTTAVSPFGTLSSTANFSFGIMPTTVSVSTTKESQMSVTAPVTTSSSFGTFPSTTTFSFGTTPTTLAVSTSKEGQTSIAAPVTTSSSFSPFPSTTTLSFGTTPSALPVSTSKESQTSITAPVTTTPSFGVSPSTTTLSFGTTSTTPQLSFGTNPVVSTISTTKESSMPTATSTAPPTVALPSNPSSTSISAPLFGVSSAIATTKDNPVPTSNPSITGASGTSTGSTFGSGTSFQPFTPISTASPATTATTIVTPTVTTALPSITPTISFGVPSSTSFSSPPTTTASTTAAVLVTTMASFTASSGFSFGTNSFPSSLMTSTNAPSIGFGASSAAPMSTVTATTTSASSFTTSSAAITFPTPAGFTFTPPTTSAAAPPLSFGSGPGFGQTSTSITNNQPFIFGAGSPPRLSTPSAVTSTNPNATLAFGSSPSFGAGPLFGTTSSFGMPSQPTDRTTSTAPPPSFSFGSTINPTTSVTPMSTSGFAYTPSTSTAPAFGTVPAPTSSNLTGNPFGFGGAATTTATTTTTITNPTPASNIFQFGAASSSMTTIPMVDNSSDPSAAPNPYDATRSDSPSNQRIILRGKRRKP